MKFIYVLIDNSYVIIRVINQEKIEVYYCDQMNDNKKIYNYPICFITDCNHINQMFVLLSIFVNIQKLSTHHKLYLGKEILSANISINLKQVYIQG
uniref:hypothetical protein n=1 Tax=Aphanocladia delicatula TaxID=3041656 RepID=UPI00255205DB|nr:hypothetical protein QQP87_pgp135 [Aphanocladia delicatula]WGH14234.1 hypothetical protein [Aphanocladia delicatula]